MEPSDRCSIVQPGQADNRGADGAVGQFQFVLKGHGFSRRGECVVPTYPLPPTASHFATRRPPKTAPRTVPNKTASSVGLTPRQQPDKFPHAIRYGSAA